MSWNLYEKQPVWRKTALKHIQNGQTEETGWHRLRSAWRNTPKMPQSGAETLWFGYKEPQTNNGPHLGLCGSKSNSKGTCNPGPSATTVGHLFICQYTNPPSPQTPQSFVDGVMTTQHNLFPLFVPLPTPSPLETTSRNVSYTNHWFLTLHNFLCLFLEGPFCQKRGQGGTHSNMHSRN